MESTIYEELLHKKESIDKLGEVLAEYIGNVTGLKYEVYEEKEHGYIQEYIIMSYRGGAIAVRNVNINSILADYEEAIRLCFGGHYDEVKSYKEMTENESWKLIIG